METSLTRHCKAIAASAANSTAFRFNTGKAPGSPRHTGHTLVFGGSPKRVEHEQKIFDAVSSWTWTSSPITGSYFASKSPETAGVVAISGDYKPPWRWSAGRLAQFTIPAGDCRASLGWTAEGGCPYATLDLWLLARSSISPAGFRSTSAHFLSRRALPSGKSWRPPAGSKCRRYRKTKTHAQWSVVPPPWRQTEPDRFHPMPCGSRLL